jgi:hypothetical protein
LLGLAVIPLIRWLHRFHASAPPVLVTALFPWRQAVPAEGQGRRRSRPSPRWWLRAAIATGLLLALTGPRWQWVACPLDVWLDDSPSLYAQETTGSRLVLAVDALLAALADRSAGPVTVRSLGDPSRSLALDPTRLNDWRSQLLTVFQTPAGLPQPPPPVQWVPTAEHWLLSVGAAPLLADWVRHAPLSRLLQVGDTTANAALITLAARPALRSADTWSVLVSLVNAGPAPVSRTLELRLDGQPVQQVPVTLAPAVTWHHSAVLTSEVLAVAGGRLEARLLPADALPLDDGAVLDLPAKPLVHLSGPCGPALRAALAAHPGLRVAPEPAATEVPAVTVVCAPTAPVSPGPRLLLPPLPQAQPLAAPPHWHAAAGPLRQLPLTATGLRSAPPPVVPTAYRPLLSVAEQPLIVAAPEEPVVTVWLDLEAPELVHQPVYPVLLNGLLEWLLGRPLLEVPLGVQRDPAAARIAPQRLPALPAVSPPVPAATSQALASWLLMVSGLLLLLDLGAVARVGREAPG